MRCWWALTKPGQHEAARAAEAVRRPARGRRSSAAGPTATMRSPPTATRAVGDHPAGRVHRDDDVAVDEQVGRTAVTRTARRARPHRRYGRRSRGIDRRGRRASCDGARSPRDYWHVVAECADVGPATARGVRLLGRDLVVWRAPDGCGRRRARPLPAPRGAAVARAPSTTAASSARTTAGRSATTAGASPCRRPARAAPVPPTAHLPAVHVAERYGLVWLCLGHASVADPDDRRGRRPAYRRINAGVERCGDVGDPDDRQLPRHRPLPVRARRHVRHRRRHPGADVRDPRRSTTTSSATRTRSRSATSSGAASSGLERPSSRGG